MSILWKTKVKIVKRLESIRNVHASIALLDQDILMKMEMINLKMEDLQIIHTIQPLIEENIEILVKDFYDTILKVDSLKEIIERNSSVNQLGDTLKTHLIELFNGCIDEDFINKRLKVAKIHFHIGLQPAWYMGAFQNLQNTLLKIIYRKVQDREEAEKISLAITKILSLEQQIVLEAYEKENANQREREFKQVRKEVQNKMLQTSKELVALSEQTTSAIRQLIQNSDEVKNNISSTYEQSKRAQQFANSGQTLIDELSKQILIILENNKLMNGSVRNLIESTNQITEVIKIVQDIADQTNLLALNSAIEAARAGEHGKGFAVVSGEVKKLAEQTKNSIAKIESLIQNSNAYTISVNDALEQVNTAITEGDEKSKLTKESFHSISTSMANSVESISNVESQMNSLVEIVKELGQSMSVLSQSAETLNDKAIIA